MTAHASPPGDGTRPPAGFMPQLDGLRAFAVVAVMVHHLLDIEKIWPALASVSWGLLGVRLFFVLSGFLITGLLLQSRDAVEAGIALRADVLKRFYARRALRIFPLYYLVLGIAFVVGGDDVRVQVPWLATYTYNFWVASLGSYTAHFSHFWSLCVEEQFYLIWPWIVLFAPRRHLVPVTVLMVLLAPLYRAVAWNLEFNPVAFFVLTPSSSDALGMGALLALAARANGPQLERRLRFTLLPIGLIGIGAVLWAGGAAAAVFAETMVALVFTWLVCGAAQGFGGLTRAVLEAPPILYLGRISYGLYVYHLLVPGVFGPVLDALGLPLPPKGGVEFILYATITVGVASLSWTCIEHPINRQKRRFADAR